MSSRLRKRWWPVAVAALLAPAVIALASASAGAGAQEPDPFAEQGRQLYAEDCLVCHGPDGRGVPATGPDEGAGPSLVGVGPAAVHLYLSLGYMPLESPDQIPKPSEPEYTPEQIDALVAYVSDLAAGEFPAVDDVDPARGDVAEGMRLFTDRCAGCHQIAVEGGVILDGVAPELERATPEQIGEAIRVGPYLMPSWSEEQITDEQVDSIAAYVLDARAPRDEGGWGIGHIGPIPEGAVAWFVTVVGLVGVALVIGRRLRS